MPQEHGTAQWWPTFGVMLGGLTVLLLIMLQRIYHYTPFQAGLFFPPPALVMGITSILAGPCRIWFNPSSC